MPMATTPFMPEDLITTAWRQLRTTLPQDMATSINYYERTWVGTERPAATTAYGLVQNVLQQPQHMGWYSTSCSNHSIWVGTERPAATTAYGRFFDA